MNAKILTNFIADNGRKTKWAITGVAGFIGSNLLQKLLESNQIVIGLDNFSTGFESNLEKVRLEVGDQLWANFSLIHGDIRDESCCASICKDVDFVLHHAALGSVPRSIFDPVATNETNVGGFVKMLLAAKNAGVKRFIYASSSSVYGSDEGIEKIESKTGLLLSPYAVSKYTNELYAKIFFDKYGLETIGLRYFNVFGPRQHERGAYAAVIPLWISSLLNGNDVFINGDGFTSRDFTYVDNVVYANFLAAFANYNSISGGIFNIAAGDSTNLLVLYRKIRENLGLSPNLKPVHRDFRVGDILHSRANIEKAMNALDYKVLIDFDDGLKRTVGWYLENL